MRAEVEVVLHFSGYEPTGQGSGSGGRPSDNRINGYCLLCHSEYRQKDGHECDRPALAPRKTGSVRRGPSSRGPVMRVVRK